MQEQELLDYILNAPHERLSHEELVHLLLENTVANSIEPRETFAQRAADRLAAFAGSWVFILSFLFVLIAWIGVNLYFGARAYDPYPFILLNLVLSCVASVQAPLIMMSQQRQEQKDRRRSENDYRVNLKSELILRDLHKKMDHILQLVDPEEYARLHEMLKKHEI